MVQISDMKLIAESGSTSTNWRIVSKEKTLAFDTKGINPLFLSETNVINDIQNNFPKEINYKDISELHFYGPGCSTEERCNIIKTLLQKLFSRATINVNTDLLAAAIALFGKKQGIACILGTGSNSGLYDGNIIIENIPSLGYILGDEGSGANLGLRFIKSYLNQQLEKELSVEFEQTYQLQLADIIDKVYREPYPNRFLASFAPFIKNNLNYPSVENLCKESFSEFIDWHILPYQNINATEVSAVGSIAAYFEDILQEVAKSKGFQFSRIVANPIEFLETRC
jgi:N-acetylglucosamine kinase-like BadF-type ATPase